MKTKNVKAFVGLLVLLAISCKKENTLQTSTKSIDHLNQVDITTVGGNAVKIGNQVWMNKDLSVTAYRNGDTIPQVRQRNKNAWIHLRTGAWCWYDNKDHKYGRLYNWYAVNDPRGLAPVGWHVASNAEWAQLIKYVGGDSVAGGKLKEAGFSHWLAPNTDATNSSGFTALPGGFRDYGFSGKGSMGYWWTSTAWVSFASYIRRMSYNSAAITKDSFPNVAGCSVRCVKD